jgi:DNA-binding Lrp family transcriptional regulator
MDETDRKLVSMLRHDARVSLSDLAIGLGVTRTTVRARMDRLRDRGEIIGFTVVLRGDAARYSVRGLMMLGIEGRGTERILRQLGGLSAVRAMHTTNGRWDVIVEIGTDTLEGLDRVLAQIRKLDGIASSETSLLLNTWKAGG